MTSTADYDYVIVGAGPAGLQMAYFLQKSKRRYVVLEAAEKAASFFAQHPRHGKLISINKKNNFFDEEEFNMRHDWNSLLSDDKKMRFTEYSDDLYPKPCDLYRYLNDYADRFQLNIKYNTKVSKIRKADGIFTVKTSSPEQDGGETTSCTARCVLMATGAVEENLPDTIPGIELTDTYSKHSLDKKLYKNKRVLIIGGGNSAFEVGDHLSDTAAIVHIFCGRKTSFAWDSHYVGDLRAVNNNIIDMYSLKSLHGLVAAQVQSITRDEEGRFKVTVKDLISHSEVPGYMFFDITYDHVISCLGWKYINPEIFDDSIVMEYARGERFPALSDCWETKTDNLFYIGTAMASIDKQSASGFIHGFRYNIRTLHNILENKLFTVPLSKEVIPDRALQTIAKKLTKRATISDALYQMNGFLCDVIVCDQNGTTKYYTELPQQYIMQREEFSKAPHVFIYHLSYGSDQFGATEKHVESQHAPNFINNECVAFLHPILEYYSYGQYVDQTELQETLLARYCEWACSNFPQWPTSANENYLKHFINEKMNWTSETFNLAPLPDFVMKRFVPLTEVEKKRLPPIWEKAECKPQQDLLRDSDTTQNRKRVLKPTREQIRASVTPQHKEGGAQPHNLAQA